MEYQYLKEHFSNAVYINKNEEKIGFFEMGFWLFKTKVIINQKEYIIKNTGFLGREFTMYNAENQEIEAELKLGFLYWKVIIILNQNRQYRLERTNFWGSKWTITNQNGEQLIFQKKTSFFERTGTITSTMSNKADADMLSSLGVFLIFLVIRRRVAAWV